mgnify:FL=1|jgi:hypothetical protein
MFYLYDKGKAQSITDAGTEIHLRMEKMFRAYGRKTKIERIYEERHNSVGSSTSFEDIRLSGWRENKDAVTKC